MSKNENDIKQIFELVAQGALQTNDATERLKKLINTEKMDDESIIKEQIQLLRDNHALSLNEKFSKLSQIIIEVVTQNHEITNDSRFADFGMDSLMVAKVMSLLNSHLKIVLPPTILFEYSTVGEANNFLINHYENQINKLFSEQFIALDENMELKEQVKNITNANDEFAKLWGNAASKTHIEDRTSSNNWVENNIDLSYVTVQVYSKGNGSPMVILGGYANTFNDFSNFCDRFTDTHRVHYINLPGHGGSSFLPEEKMKLDEIINVIDQSIRYLSINEPITLLGYSLGGTIAQAYVKKFPTQIQRLILIATNCINIIIDNFMQKLINEIEFTKGSNILIPQCLGSPLLISSYEPFFKELPQVQIIKNETTSVLIIHGEADQLIGNNNKLLLEQNYALKKCHTISKAGHFLIWTHQNEVVDFIQKNL